MEAFGALIGEPSFAAKIRNIAFHAEKETRWFKGFAQVARAHLPSLTRVMFVHYGDSQSWKRTGGTVYLDDITHENLKADFYEELEQSWNTGGYGDEIEYLHTLPNSIRRGRERYHGVVRDLGDGNGYGWVLFDENEEHIADEELLQEDFLNLRALSEDIEVIDRESSVDDEDMDVNSSDHDDSIRGDSMKEEEEDSTFPDTILSRSPSAEPPTPVAKRHLPIKASSSVQQDPFDSLAELARFYPINSEGAKPSRIIFSPNDRSKPRQSRDGLKPMKTYMASECVSSLPQAAAVAANMGRLRLPSRDSNRLDVARRRSSDTNGRVRKLSQRVRRRESLLKRSISQHIFGNPNAIPVEQDRLIQRSLEITQHSPSHITPKRRLLWPIANLGLENISALILLHTYTLSCHSVKTMGREPSLQS